MKLFQALEINDYSVLLGIHDLEGGVGEGKHLLHKHDKEGLKHLHGGSFKLKVDQVLDQDYGLLPLVQEQRFKTAFYECIEGGVLSRDMSKLYFVGIIDILTFFGTKKKFEYNFKSIVHGQTVSCVPPQRYGDRFKKYMRE